MDALVSRLTDLMHENGDDQSSLARKVGCTPAAINQILTGRTHRSKFLPEIAELYEVTLGFLTGRSNDRGPQLQIEDRMTAEDRRLFRLFQRLGREERNLVLSLVERLAGVKPIATPPAPAAQPDQTFHDRQFWYKPGEAGPTWGD